MGRRCPLDSTAGARAVGCGAPARDNFGVGGIGRRRFGRVSAAAAAPGASLRHRLLAVPGSGALLAAPAAKQWWWHPALELCSLAAPDGCALARARFFFFSEVRVSGKGVRNEGWAAYFCPWGLPLRRHLDSGLGRIQRHFFCLKTFANTLCVGRRNADI